MAITKSPMPQTVKALIEWLDKTLAPALPATVTKLATEDSRLRYAFHLGQRDLIDTMKENQERLDKRPG